MSSTHVPTSAASSTASSTTTRPGRQSVGKPGVAAAVVASIATTTSAALASAAGVSFADRTGSGIPIAAFAELTLIFSLIGVGLAAVMARKARRPRTTFTRTALTLTAVSFIPDLTFGFDVASAATLIALHTLAAAIVVTTLAGRLPHTR
jgi:peptidoglycan/LPS O-acetylase OafA/YrhL